jgi:carbon storage regulator
MLVLTRKLNQSIIIDGHIRITVTSIRTNQVRIGITAPEAVQVLRAELCDEAAGGAHDAALRSDGAASESAPVGWSGP